MGLLEEETQGGPELRPGVLAYSDNSGDLCHQDMEHIIQELQNKATREAHRPVTKIRATENALWP